MEVIVHTHTNLLADIYHDWPEAALHPLNRYYIFIFFFLVLFAAKLRIFLIHDSPELQSLKQKSHISLIINNVEKALFLIALYENG